MFVLVSFLLILLKEILLLFLLFLLLKLMNLEYVGFIVEDHVIGLVDIDFTIIIFENE